MQLCRLVKLNGRSKCMRYFPERSRPVLCAILVRFCEMKILMAPLYVPFFRLSPTSQQQPEPIFACNSATAWSALVDVGLVCKEVEHIFPWLSCLQSFRLARVVLLFSFFVSLIVHEIISQIPPTTIAATRPIYIEWWSKCSRHVVNEDSCTCANFNL